MRSDRFARGKQASELDHYGERTMLYVRAANRRFCIGNGFEFAPCIRRVHNRDAEWVH